MLIRAPEVPKPAKSAVDAPTTGMAVGDSQVIVLSRNDPDTGLRVMNSIEHHGLDVSRAVFTQGQAPFTYIPALSISLFLSANGDDVRQAIAQGYPAHVMPETFGQTLSEEELKQLVEFLVEKTSKGG